MEEIINKLNETNKLIEELEKTRDELKSQIIENLKNTESKNYRTDKALYSLKTISNDKFNELKFKEEHEDVYNNYLKTKVSFDITTFKKKEKDLLEEYTEKGEITYSLQIKETQAATQEETQKIESLDL